MKVDKGIWERAGEEIQVSRGLEERGDEGRAEGGVCGGVRGKKAQREGIGHRRVWEKGKRAEDMSGSAGERGGGKRKSAGQGIQDMYGSWGKGGEKKVHRDVGHVGVSGRGGREQSTGGIQGSGGGGLEKHGGEERVEGREKE